MTWINFNGKILESGTPVIEADNRGLRYGDGLFETIKYKNNRLLMLDEHLARLWNGMRLMSFELPKHFTPDHIETEMLQLLKKNRHTCARIRLTVVRGNGGLYDPKNHAPQYIIQTWPLEENGDALNQNGLHLTIYNDAIKSADKFSQTKNNNYLPYLLGALHAKKEKCNDAIILNQFGRICDSTIANIFIIRQEEIITPALTEGCVAGVMRNRLIRILKNNGQDVLEKEITRDDLFKADEVFLTNAIYNIRWVAAIDRQSFVCNKTLQLCGLLKTALIEHL